ncbi:MAG TPA: hypothetical protein VHW01_24070, partial [Polyangiaceae bacterium]|nr:hypothetical protein [Polyangiaceae bacterium]
MSQDAFRLRALLGLCIAIAVVGCVDGSIQPGQNGAAPAVSGGAGTGAMATGTVADGSCHDTQSDPANCGACGHACASGQTCALGVCQTAVSSCSAPLSLCSGACVDLAATANCGACGNACAAGQSCTAGACVCPNMQTACNGACIDTQTSNDNCGACNQPCATGATCSAGKCGCAQGQELCGGVCADLQQSEANCGACGQACATGATCGGGVCVTGAGADGCSGKALGVTLSQIAVYQSVKIGVMDAGAEIATTKRATDVVSGRATLFRLSVTVDTGFAPRQLSGRVTLSNGTTITQYFGTQMVSKSSLDTDPTSTFQVYVPPEQITADTHYSAELVECATGSGNAGTTRFPATGDIPLGARLTGGVKVTIVPLSANNMLPDTSDAALTVYKQQLIAMYPIDSVTFAVAPQMSIAFPVDWEAALDQMRSRRKTDNPADDVYYFGLVKAQNTFAQFCGNGCTTGIGYVAAANAPSFRAAMGVGFADRESAQTMAHELGHNHGRNHAPCVPKGGTISGVDPNYPFPDGRTGVIGYDARTKALLPDTGTDLMGYCSNVWLSEYTYKGITDRVALVNGNTTQSLNTTPLKTWRVLLLSSKGPRWGMPITRPSLPEGTAVTADILDGKGALLTQVDVYRTELSDGGSAVAMVPEPKAGWSAIQV